MASSTWTGQWQEFEKFADGLDDNQKILLEQKLQKVYGLYEVPIAVRKTLALMLENVSSDDSLSQEDLDAEGTLLYNAIIQELHNQAQEKTFPANSSLNETMVNFKKKFEGNPIILVHHIRTCLVQEGQVLADSKAPKSDDDRRRWYQENCGQVTSALNAIKGNAEQCEKKLEVLQEKTCRLQESMKDLQVQEEKLKKKSAKTSPENKTDHQKKNDKQLELLQLEITKETQGLTAFREETVRVLLRISDSLLEKLQEAWGCIDVYEKQQKFVILDERNGPPEGALKELNDMSEVVNEVLVRVAQLFAYMGEINTSFQDDPIRKAVEERLQLFNNAFLNHLERIIVIDKHPNQVMKVSKGRSLKFTMSLRILGPDKLGLNVNRPRVTANLHAEKDLAKELEGSTVSQGMAIQNAENVEAKFDNSTKQLRVNFSTQINALKRASDGRSRDERVTEHKYGMIFSVKLIVTGKELLVKKLSLPIVLTTQSSQEWAAKGTLIWDAAFSEDKRTIYQDAARVTWKDLGELLKNLFQMTTNRPLTPDSLQYLAQRLFGGGENEDFSAREVTKEMFIKNKLEGLSFSLWGWIHACINLIRQSISKEWEEGLIHGFVSREKADELMRDCPVGTFMLRFKASEISDSQSANNTAILAPSAVVDNGGNKNVHHWDFKKNLPDSKMNLARKLQSCQITSHDNEDLKERPFRILYPDTPFENAFQGFIEEDEHVPIPGYDPIVSKIELQISSLNLRNQSVPNSPASSTFSSSTVTYNGLDPMSPDDGDFPDTTIPEISLDWLTNATLGLPVGLPVDAVEVQQMEPVPIGVNGDQLTALMDDPTYQAL